MQMSLNPIDYIGKTYNNLTILSVFLKNINIKKRGSYATAQCKCGIIKDYALYRIKSGHTQSCGCIRDEKIKTANRTYGLCTHPLYRLWQRMKDRCYNKNNKCYKRYGGRGVHMTAEWLDSFKTFYDWAILNGWEKGLEIDKDIKGNGLLYSPETCCFVTSKVNCRNTRRCRFITHNGESKCISEWAEILGIKYYIVLDKINKGWSIEKIDKVKPQSLR